jgi:hypothetical protein
MATRGATRFQIFLVLAIVLGVAIACSFVIAQNPERQLFIDGGPSTAAPSE